MTANQPPPSDHEPGKQQLRGPGIVFLACGIAFLGVGVATGMTVFAMTAPAFIAMGIVYLVRARKRTGDDGQS